VSAAPAEWPLIAQALADGFDLLHGTLTRLGDSEPVAAPRQAADALTGPDYPEGWSAADEEGWQHLVEDVDTDQWIQAQRLSPVEPVGCLSVGGVCPRPSGTGDDRHPDRQTPTDTTRD